MEGVLYHELQKLDETVTLKVYQERFIRLTDELEQKRSFTEEENRQVILQNENTRPHVIKGAKETIFNLGWEILHVWCILQFYSKELTFFFDHRASSLRKVDIISRYCILISTDIEKKILKYEK